MHEICDILWHKTEQAGPMREVLAGRQGKNLPGTIAQVYSKGVSSLRGSGPAIAR